jgi:cbb3-type cytochrome oxidase subunit 1
LNRAPANGAARQRLREEDPMSIRFFKAAVVYLVIGVSLGVYMGATGNHTQHPTHAHLNLLGWASMALFGLFYQAFPASAETRLARWHFWIHQLSVPVLMALLFYFLTGHPEVDPLIGVLSIVAALGILLFAVNVWRTLPATK